MTDKYYRAGYAVGSVVRNALRRFLAGVVYAAGGFTGLWIALKILHLP